MTDSLIRRVPSSVGNPVDVDRVTIALLGAHNGGLPSGGTFDSQGRPYNGSGYLVATVGHELQLWDDQFDWIDSRTGQVRQVASDVYYSIAEWVREVAHEVTSRADYWFGIWHDGEGYVYLDVTQSYSDEDPQVAVQAGIARKQRSIYKAFGNGNGAVIWL